eukprot:SM000141S00887  [mRNA]  locus=s141:318599:323764:+ [translate_table: standard]
MASAAAASVAAAAPAARAASLAPLPLGAALLRRPAGAGLGLRANCKVGRAGLRPGFVQRCKASSATTERGATAVAAEAQKAVLQRKLPAADLAAPSSRSNGKPEAEAGKAWCDESTESGAAPWEGDSGGGGGPVGGLPPSRVRTVRDYLSSTGDIVKPDGGPPRWFTPLDVRPAKPGLPLLFFLPGIDGTGLGLVLHHESLSRMFEMSCLNIPTSDRTTFAGLVELVEQRLIEERKKAPNRPLYIIGESFGGTLALAIAARNPSMDLQLVVVNPATSFDRTPLKPLFPFLQSIPPLLYRVVPFALSTTLGDPVRMAAAGLDGEEGFASAAPWERALKIRDNLVAMLPQLPLMADILPQETLAWKLKLLKEGQEYTEPLLPLIENSVVIVASGKDGLLPSAEEAKRLRTKLKKCRVRNYRDAGHSILLEEGLDLGSLIKGVGMYKRGSGNSDPVLDFVPPSPAEVYRGGGIVRFLRQLTSPVFFSTCEETGKVIQGLSHLRVKENTPLLFVGNHQLFATDLGVLVEGVLREKNLLLRGLAHPAALGIITRDEEKGGSEETSFDQGGLGDFFRTFGAVPVSGNSLYKLLQSKQAALLYPGGVREAYKRKGEEYKLFWPERPEFVRMATKHGATIIPVAAIGADDGLQIVFDTEEVLQLPFLGDRARRTAQRVPSARPGRSTREVDETFVAPIVAPKLPRRLYFLFGAPIQTAGKSCLQHLLKDKEGTEKLYQQVKAELEDGLSYLLEKREEDPYDSFVFRAFFEATWGGRQAPTFTP